MLTLELFKYALLVLFTLIFGAFTSLCVYIYHKRAQYRHLPGPKRTRLVKDNKSKAQLTFQLYVQVMIMWIMTCTYSERTTLSTTYTWCKWFLSSGGNQTLVTRIYTSAYTYHADQTKWKHFVRIKELPSNRIYYGTVSYCQYINIVTFIQKHWEGY